MQIHETRPSLGCALLTFGLLSLVTGWDRAEAATPAAAATKVAVVGFSNLDPTSAETPMVVTVAVQPGSRTGNVVLECEVLDYWFRPSYLRKSISLKPGQPQRYELSLDAKTRERLFKMRNEFGQNSFLIRATVNWGKRTLGQAVRVYQFRNRVKKYEPLPPLPAKTEKVDDLFGECRLVDEVRCYDPADPHPYVEGGRGLGAKYTGAVPQFDWMDIYRERNPRFTSVETLAGNLCRETHGWGWFAYKLNRTGLIPGKAYLLVVEYPEDVGRSYSIWNTGYNYGFHGDQGFHTGKTLGDHWTRTINAGYVDYPLSGRYQHWSSLFYLADKVWMPGYPNCPVWTPGYPNGPKGMVDSRDGFWVLIGGVGPSMDALAGGAAVRTIKLYQVDAPASLRLKVRRPPAELGQRDIFATSECNGDDYGHYPQLAKERLEDALFYGFSGLAPNHFGSEKAILKTNHGERLGVKVISRVMFGTELFAKLKLPADGSAVAIRPDGQPAGVVYPGLSKTVVDILHPEVLPGVLAILDEKLKPEIQYPELAGMMLYQHYERSITISFGDRALRMFEKETGTRIPATEAQARRSWVLSNKKNEYYQWWYGKERQFLLAVRDHLQHLRPDLKLFYFPWHGDDDYPFAVGRLRYEGLPEHDKVYVPGTNILLVPRFIKPRDQWSKEEKLHPETARNYYREQIDPALAGRITLEDIIYGRYKDRPEFWGAKRSGELPHLLYPEQLDLVKMIAEPGGVYSRGYGVGISPRLYRQDRAIVLWVPVHYRFTADNAKFLDMFRTGEGVAVANGFPYNEEQGVGNCFGLNSAMAMEHAGPFCMMEEVLAMANADPTNLMVGMWPPPKRGFPAYARAFAAAYLALPALPSKVLAGAIEPADPDIIVRAYATPRGMYLAVINKAFSLDRKEVKLTVEGAPASIAAVEDLVAGDKIPYEASGEAGVRFAMRLEPMSLRSLRIIPRPSTP